MEVDSESTMNYSTTINNVKILVRDASPLFYILKNLCRSVGQYFIFNYYLLLTPIIQLINKIYYCTKTVYYLPSIYANKYIYF